MNRPQGNFLTVPALPERATIISGGEKWPTWWTTLLSQIKLRKNFFGFGQTCLKNQTTYFYELFKTYGGVPLSVKY